MSLGSPERSRAKDLGSGEQLAAGQRALHHGGTPGAPGAAVWVRTTSGRLFEVEAGSAEHERLLAEGGEEVAGP